MPGDEHDPQQALESALALASSGEYAEAHRCVERVLASRTGCDPHAAARALAAIARAAEPAGDAELARRSLEAALGLVDWADLHLALGTLLARDGEAVAARKAFDRALELNPRYRAAAVERALLDAREGRVADAISALRTLTGGASSEADSVLREGMDRLRAAAVDDAAPWLRQAFAGGDEALERLLVDARESLRTGDVSAGLRSLRRAVDDRPGYADLHALLGSHELRAGLLDDGLASLVHALELNPDYHAARLELARGLEARGARDQALEQLDAVLQAEPAHPVARALYDRLTSRRRASAAA